MSVQAAPGLPSCPEGGWERSRPRRVLVLLLGVVLLSLGDLALTLTHAASVGIAEMNPLARTIMAHHSPLGIVLWKVASVSLCVLLLLRVRRSWIGELGAWIGLSIMVALTIHWARYNDAMLSYMPDLQQVTPTDPRWVVLSSAS
ncbi:MAG: DUF5658 family protein [Phycisphaerales bacterium]|nr:DUF5658 family protein [Phycisphaerales bacterium]